MTYLKCLTKYKKIKLKKKMNNKNNNYKKNKIKIKCCLIHILNIKIVYFLHKNI